MKGVSFNSVEVLQKLSAQKYNSNVVVWCRRDRMVVGYIYNGKMVKKTKQQKLFKQPYLEQQRFFELVKSPYWFDIRH